MKPCVACTFATKCKGASARLWVSSHGACRMSHDVFFDVPTRKHHEEEGGEVGFFEVAKRRLHYSPSLSEVMTTLLLIAAAIRLGLVSCSTNVFHLPLLSHNNIVERRVRERERERALLEGSSGSNLAKQQIDALYQGYGTHYIDLWVGTPPQRQTVIVATGSPKTAFPCSKCDSCGELYHTDAYFLENESTTYRVLENCQCKFGFCSENQCLMSTSYAEGSMWSGVESIDTTYAGGPHNKIQKLPGTFNEKDKDDADPLRAQNFAFDHAFACMNKATGLFRTQLADGIMGMDNARESFWYQAYDNGMIEKKAFALCLSRKSDSSRQGTEAGALTMGGHDKRLHTSPMVYTKLDVATFFVVTLRRIYLREGGSGSGDSIVPSSQDLRVIPLPLQDSFYDRYDKVMIDSGTTDTYFPRGFMAAFKQEWQSLTGMPYSHERVFLTQEEFDNLPTIIIQLVGSVELNNVTGVDPSKTPGLAASIDPDNPYDIVIAIPPSHYMEPDYGSGGYVPRFYVDERGYKATLGANAMMGHDILFDVEEGAMGFAESHCDYTKLEKDVADAEEAEQTEGEDNDQSDEIDTTSVVDVGSTDDTSLTKSTDYTSEETESSAEGSGLPLFALTLTLFFAGGGYVAFDRFGLREKLARRKDHGRLPTNDDNGDHELELQYVNPNPIV